MALIFAMVSSVIGLVAGSVAMLVFGASFLAAVGIYFVTAVGGIVLGSTIALLPQQHATRSYSEEDFLDDTWREVAAAAYSPEEEAFQRQLDTPLSGHGADRDSA